MEDGEEQANAEEYDALHQADGQPAELQPPAARDYEQRWRCCRLSFVVIAGVLLVVSMGLALALVLIAATSVDFLPTACSVVSLEIFEERYRSSAANEVVFTVAGELSLGDSAAAARYQARSSDPANAAAVLAAATNATNPEGIVVQYYVTIFAAEAVAPDRQVYAIPVNSSLLRCYKPDNGVPENTLAANGQILFYAPNPASSGLLPRVAGALAGSISLLIISVAATSLCLVRVRHVRRRRLARPETAYE
jgi:hypothetical protein